MASREDDPKLESVGPDDDEQKSCFEVERTIWTRIWQGVAAASLGLNIASMAIEGTAVVIVAGIIACIIAPIVIYLQMRLQDTETLRMVQNALRKEAGRLHVENNKLSSQVTRLETQVGRLKDEEKKLENITSTQGTNVDNFVQLVQENQKTLDQLKTALKANLTQTLVTALIDSDVDSSGHFSDQEIQIVELRLKNVPGVTVNHDLLVQSLKASDRQLSSVLKFVDQLEEAELPAEKRIFQFDETHLVKPQ